jgi:hypothetical protein
VGREAGFLIQSFRGKQTYPPPLESRLSEADKAEIRQWWQEHSKKNAAGAVPVAAVSEPVEIEILAPEGKNDEVSYEGRTIEEWIRQFDSESYEDRKEAIAALTQIGRSTVPAMMELMKDGGMRASCARGVLGKMGPAAEDAVAWLIEVALDKDVSVGQGWESAEDFRKNVVSCLAKMKWASQRVIPVLETIAADNEDDTRLRRFAVLFLRDSRKQAIPILRKLAQDDQSKIRNNAHHMLAQLLLKEEGLSKEDYYTPLIERDLFDASVPEYLAVMKGPDTRGRPHPITQKVKRLYRQRLAQDLDPRLANALVMIILDGLRNTELGWAAPAEGSKVRWPRQDPAENHTSLAQVMEIGFDHAESGSELWRQFGLGLAKLRLLQGRWDDMNETLILLDQKPIPKEPRPWLAAPPADWKEGLASRWKMADQSMRSGNCSLVFRIEKDGKGLKGAHVLVKRAPEPTIGFSTGVRIDTLLHAPYPYSFGYAGHDRQMTRYAVSDESGLVRFDKLPNIRIKVEVLVPTSNFEELGTDWDLWMEVEPGKYKMAKKYGAGAINTQEPPAVAELKAGATVHYPKLVVRPAFGLNIRDWDPVDKDNFVLRWQGLDPAQVEKGLQYELQMSLSAPSAKGIPLIQSAEKTLKQNQWPVGAKGLGGLRLEPGNIYVFEVSAVDNSGTVIARWPKTRVWIPWPHRKTLAPCPGLDTIGRPPDVDSMPPLDKDGMWWRGEYTDRHGHTETMSEKVERYLRESPDAFEYEYIRLGKAWLQWHDGDAKRARQEFERLTKELPRANLVRSTALWLLQQMDQGKAPQKGLKFVPDRDTNGPAAAHKETNAKIEAKGVWVENGARGV